MTDRYEGASCPNCGVAPYEAYDDCGAGGTRRYSCDNEGCRCEEFTDIDVTDLRGSPA